MIWATVSSGSCFCWLYRTSPSLAAKILINLISPLTISWFLCGASLVTQLVKNPPATREMWVWSLGWEYPLEKGKATHSSILAGEFLGLYNSPWGHKKSHLDFKDIKPVHPKGSQPWIFIGRTDAEAETPILWLPDVKNWLIEKDPDAGKDWRREDKGMTEDKIIGWHYWLDWHQFEQAPGVGDGQGSLVSCSPWDHKDSDTTERLKWTELMSMWGVISCVVGWGCLLWPVCSLGKTVSLCLLHFVLQGQTCLLLQVSLDFLLLHSSPLWWKEHLFLVLVLEGLIGHHRTVQLQLLLHWCLGHRLGLLWYWMVFLRNKQIILLFLRLHPSTALWTLVDYRATPFLPRDSCPQELI